MSFEFNARTISPQDRQEFADSMLALGQEITKEIECPEMNPGRLMRLTAAGVNQCLLGLATLWFNFIGINFFSTTSQHSYAEGAPAVVEVQATPLR